MKPLSPKLKSCFLLALFHLGLVVLGAAHISLEDRFGVAGKILGFYSLASGADSTYGFFSPGVGSQLRARLEWQDSQGQFNPTKLETGTSREADLRVGNIISRFSSATHDKPLRRAFTASWAGKIFARYPEARSVKVSIDEMNLVSMDQYRKGERPRWKNLYEAKYDVKKRP